MEMNIPAAGIITQNIDADWLQARDTRLSVLRLDMLHPIVSGNKWFKLKYYLQEATEAGVTTIGTFGGPYSNHIVATAYAAKLAGKKAIGIIRGEESPVLSDTLQDARNYGMQLHFLSRAAYRDAEIIKTHFENVYWIDEGGYGIKGMLGAAAITGFATGFTDYTHIVCAVGTGTMIAGIIHAAKDHQTIIGISVMKGNVELDEKINSLLDDASCAKSFEVIHDYHFGGYAKHPPKLLHYMNDVWVKHQLPTDIVYTAKTFFAAEQLIINNTISAGSNVLMIHSGGLQGNRSLPDNILLF